MRLFRKEKPFDAKRSMAQMIPFEWDRVDINPDGSFGPIHHMMVKNRGDESG